MTGSTNPYESPQTDAVSPKAPPAESKPLGTRVRRVLWIVLCVLFAFDVFATWEDSPCTLFGVLRSTEVMFTAAVLLVLPCAGAFFNGRWFPLAGCFGLWIAVNALWVGIDPGAGSPESLGLVFILGLFLAGGTADYLFLRRARRRRAYIHEMAEESGEESPHSKDG